MLARRTLLVGTAASVVVVAGGAASFALTREPTHALAPWSAAGRYRDPRLNALSWAVLAPNPHNRQPWLVRLDGGDRTLVFCDAERRLPETDPFDRQITIGFGAFLEIFRMAAAEAGYSTLVEPFPEGEPGPRLDGRPVARITLTAGPAVARDPLLAHVPARRSNKEPFDTGRPVPPALLGQLLDPAEPGVRGEGTVDPARVGRLRDLTWSAHRVETGTARTHAESVRLMRIGRAEIEARPDGIDLGGPFLEALHLAGVLNRGTLADPASSAYAQGMAMYRDIIGSAMGHVWLSTPGDGRRDQLAAGRAWVRLNLRATGLGLAVHPLSQALQEFPEMDASRRAVNAELGVVAPRRLQMLGRVGFGPPVPPSPRWRAETRLIAA